MPRPVATYSEKKNILAALEVASSENFFLRFIYVYKVLSEVFIIFSFSYCWDYI